MDSGTFVQIDMYMRNVSICSIVHSWICRIQLPVSLPRVFRLYIYVYISITNTHAFTNICVHTYVHVYIFFYPVIRIKLREWSWSHENRINLSRHFRFFPIILPCFFFFFLFLYLYVLFPFLRFHPLPDFVCESIRQIASSTIYRFFTLNESTQKFYSILYYVYIIYMYVYIYVFMYRYKNMHGYMCNRFSWMSYLLNLQFSSIFFLLFFFLFI